MAVNDYHFVSTWILKGNIEEVYDILSDPLHYPDWWLPGYLTAKEIKCGSNGIGRIVALDLKHAVFYSLHWELESFEAVRPHHLAALSHGDFEGKGIWTLSQAKDEVRAVFDWQIKAQKPFLKTFSFFLRPFFIWNHNRVMAAGELGLNRQLAISNKLYL